MNGFGKQIGKAFKFLLAIIVFLLVLLFSNLFFMIIQDSGTNEFNVNGKVYSCPKQFSFNESNLTCIRVLKADLN